MSKKTIILTIMYLLFIGGAFAQDRIFQSNGNVIEAKIKEVNNENVIYWHWNNIHGAVYAISLHDVDKIRYESGTEERFNGENEGETMHRGPWGRRAAHHEFDIKLGSRVLAAAPIQFTENGVGFSVGYEKALDRAGIIAFTLPVIATFNLNNQSEDVANKHQDAMFYFAPGLKFYPTGGYGRTKYAVGPSLVIGAGEKTTGGEYSYYSGYGGYHTGFTPYETSSKFILGILVNNSLNINPAPHLYLGMDFGFGFTYINQVGGVNQGITGMVQGGFKMGYRY